MSAPPADPGHRRWPGRQRRIGLTGGIATGKSAVGHLLAARGVPVLDADAYAREALAPGRGSTRAVLERYGSRVRAPRDPGAARQADEPAAIDRAALGRIVFREAGERRWLEQLLHPLVRERFEAELNALQQAPVVVLMIPLLFEAGLEALCSEVWVVGCDDEQQRQRLMARDRLSADDAEARICSQWPLERKKTLADVWIDNRQGLDQLEPLVARALDGGPHAPATDLTCPAA